MRADGERIPYLFKGGNQNAETLASTKGCRAGAGSWCTVDGIVVGMADQLRAVGPCGEPGRPSVDFYHAEQITSLYGSAIQVRLYRAQAT
jgi:hypothetical protein